MNKLKTIGVVVLMLVCWAGASAVNRKSVSNVRFQQSNGKYTITYDLKDDAVVNLSVKGRLNGSIVTKDVYVTGKKENDKVTGDVGYVMAGRNKVIEWQCSQDAQLSGMNYVVDFNVEPKDIFPKAKTTLLGTFGYAFKPEQMSYGLMLGVTSNKSGCGMFMHLRSNYNFGVKADYTCDANGKIDNMGCFYTGETKVLYYMANAGLMVNMLKNKHTKSMVALAIGAGYGQRNVYWQMDSGSWALNSGTSLKGVTAELNLVGSIKGFTLMAGVNTLNFKYVELEVGIGVTF